MLGTMPALLCELRVPQMLKFGRIGSTLSTGPSVLCL